MKNIEISIKCVGDYISGLGECLIIAKAIEEAVIINYGGFSITVNPDSNILDLFEIYSLNIKLQK